MKTLTKEQIQGFERMRFWYQQKAAYSAEMLDYPDLGSNYKRITFYEIYNLLRKVNTDVEEPIKVGEPELSFLNTLRNYYLKNKQ